MKWFHLGAKEVYLSKKYLNSINVFPVADGDTGNNLSATLRSMSDHAHQETTFSGMLHSIAEEGLAHARGNSGILFASYIKGLALEGRIFDVASIKDFSYIAFQAVDYLYQAIDNPREGTMISVIKDWASFLFYNYERYSNFKEFLSDAYQVAHSSLLKTTTQLEVLKKNNVVDSGAEGFIRFLLGINRYYDGTEAEESLYEPANLVVATDEHESEFTYCTELFLQVTNPSTSTDSNLQNDIMQKLKTMGDSLIVSTQGNKIRVHIHTDQPDVIAKELQPYGIFLEQKVDNMHLQKNVKTNQISKIGIVTDSIADLPEEYKTAHQIHTLPLGLLLGESVYLDKLTIGLESIFPMLKNLDSYPTSSQPEPGRVSIFLENLLDLYDSLIFISVASKLSGTYNTLCQVAKKLERNGKKISVIDSRLNSGAQGLLVTHAAELIDQGISHDEIVQKIENMIPKTKIYVCLNTMEYAVKSGRVPRTIGKIGMKLGMRPIMTLDPMGNGAAFGVAFSKRSITKKIYRLIKRTLRTERIKSYSIVHAGNAELAQEYQQALTKIIGKEPAYISEISSIIAIHSGPGSVAVCLTIE